MQEISPTIQIKKRAYSDGIFYFLPRYSWSMYNENKVDKHINEPYEKQEIITVEEFIEQWMICTL